MSETNTINTIMASENNTPKHIKVKVPEGFLPQSIPVKPDQRISSDSVRLEIITKDDLMPIVRLRPLS